VPVQHASEDSGHRRRERRTLPVMGAPRGHPHIRQAVAVFIITSLDACEATPDNIASYVRGHWTM
jgi:hypothetical protein